MRWTEQQRRTIEENGYNILVSAAAGSGKTAVLTERIKRLVTEQRVPINRMLVATFTNPAAAEMREKIIKALKKAAGEKDRNSGERAFLQRQIRLADIADISTFHSFAIKIIRKYFYMADVDPRFGICDESRSEIMKQQCLDEMFDELYRKSDPDFIAFMDMYSNVGNDRAVRSMTDKLRSFMMSMPEPFEWLERSIEKLNITDEDFKKGSAYRLIKEDIRLHLKNALKISEEVEEYVSYLPNMARKAGSDRASIEIMLGIASEEEPDMDALRSAMSQKFERFTAVGDEKEDFSAIKDEVKEKRELMKQEIKAAGANIAVSPEEEARRVRATYEPARMLAEMVRDYDRRYTKMKAERRVLDFSDTEHIALKILQNSDVASEMKKNYEYIFVDEYQDSSLIQEAIINRISRGGNVYMTGDVKQSIYKFRLAEPEMFIGKYNSFDTGDSGDEFDTSKPGRRIDLNMNFRSKGNIINAVNGIFRNVMSAENGGIAYDSDAELHRGVDYEGELDRPVTLHIVENDLPEELELPEDDPIAALGREEAEAKMVASLAAERIGQTIFDHKQGIERSVSYRDIVILMRAVKGRADIYAEALKEQGIPAYLDDGEGYFETAEIEVFMNLLRIIDNRYRDIPLISVLRSPVFGFSTGELADIRLSDMKSSFSDAFFSYCEKNNNKVSENLSEIDIEGLRGFEKAESGHADQLLKKCADVRSKLGKWRSESRYMSLPDFLWRLMTETGYLDYVSALYGGSRRAANLRALVDKAVAFTSSQMKGMFGFIRYVEALNRSGARIGQMSGDGGSEDAVRITTIHKSKGLEYPVVIVAGLGRQPKKNAGSPLVMHNKLGLGLRYSVPEKNIHAMTAVMRNITEQNKREEAAEETRLLYVAMTRAADELVMTGTCDNAQKLKPGSFLSMIVPHAESAGIKVFCANRHDIMNAYMSDGVSEQKVKDFRDSLRRGFPEFKDTGGLMKIISDRFEFKYPYLSSISSRSKFTVTELNRMSSERKFGKNIGNMRNEELPELNFDSVVPKFMKAEEDGHRISAVRRGTLTHRVMELIPFEDSASDEGYVRDFVTALTAKNIFTAEEAAAVDTAKIAAFFNSEAGKRALSSGWLRREWPFTMRMEDGVLVQGVIDCCFEDRDKKTVIIDFKTDRIRWGDEDAKKAKAEEYRIQLHIYRDAVERELGGKVSEVMLYMLDSSEAITVYQENTY